MVVKGKGSVGLKPPSAVITIATSRESTIANTTLTPTPAPAQRIEEAKNPSDEDQVNATQLQALRKRVEEREEYTRLL